MMPMVVHAIQTRIRKYVSNATDMKELSKMVNYLDKAYISILLGAFTLVE